MLLKNTADGTGEIHPSGTRSKAERRMDESKDVIRHAPQPFGEESRRPWPQALPVSKMNRTGLLSETGVCIWGVWVFAIP